VLGSQGIVVKCTAAIFFPTVDWCRCISFSQIPRDLKINYNHVSWELGNSSKRPDEIIPCSSKNWTTLNKMISTHLELVTWKLTWVRIIWLPLNSPIFPSRLFTQKCRPLADGTLQNHVPHFLREDVSLRTKNHDGNFLLLRVRKHLHAMLHI